ncbi:MAG: hypothetical protein ACYTGB_20325 [Planctomycetota bacterium]|jgi:hypothetical protein
MRSIAKLLGLAVLAALAFSAGCSGGGVEAPQTELVAGEGSPGFLDRMSSQTEVSENDAMRGILMLLEGADPAKTFAERVSILRRRGIVAKHWDCKADRPVTRGRLAYMIYQACKVPGGVILTLTGPSCRYCLRELQYRGLMDSGAVFCTVTGLEYTTVLTRADDYMATGKVPETMNPVGGR